MSDPSRRWISAARSGREPCFGAVVHGAEGDAVVVERRDRVAEREHLEPARIGKDRAAPPGEGMQAAERFDHVLAGAEVEVVGVAEDRRRRRAREPRRDGAPLTVPLVPTGMNAGVRISPCVVAMTPDRAAPSVAATRKLTSSTRRRTPTRPRGHPAPPPAMSVTRKRSPMGHGSAPNSRQPVTRAAHRSRQSTTIASPNE